MCHISHSVFCAPRNIMDTYTSAGILPICRHPLTHRPFAILGREEYSSRYKRWCDFGGKRKSTDADVYHSAAREFCEESVHSVFLENLSGTSVEQVAQHLRDGNYILKISIDKAGRGRRCIFVVMARYDEGLTQRFAALRAAQMQLDRYRRRDRGPDMVPWLIPGTLINPTTGECCVIPDYFEKAAIQLWAFDDLQMAADNNGYIPYHRRSACSSYFRLDFVPLLRVLLPILSDPEPVVAGFTGAVSVCTWQADDADCQH